jgi:putative endonuclease
MASRRTGRRLANCESKDCAHHADDGIVVKRCITSTCYRCADNSLYVGETSNLQTREQDHNDGRGGSYTAKRRPVRIVYAEKHNSKQEALKRERQIKRWSLQKKELLVRGDVEARVSARELASEPDSRGVTGWPGQRNDSYSLPSVPTPDRRRLVPRSSGASPPFRTSAHTCPSKRELRPLGQGYNVNVV